MATLREVRAAKLLTIRELAGKAGVAPSTIYLIENRRSMPRFAMIRKLSEVLGVAPTDVEEFAAAITERGKEPTELSPRFRYSKLVRAGLSPSTALKESVAEQ